MSGPAPRRAEPPQHHQPGMDGLGSSSVAEAPGSELCVSQRCALGAKAANSLWGCVNRNTAHGLRGGIFPLYAVDVKPHLDTVFVFGPPSTGQTWTNWRGLIRGGSRAGAVAW